MYFIYFLKTITTTRSSPNFLSPEPLCTGLVLLSGTFFFLKLNCFMNWIVEVETIQQGVLYICSWTYESAQIKLLVDSLLFKERRKKFKHQTIRWNTKNSSIKPFDEIHQILCFVGCAPLYLTSEVMLNYISSSSSLNDCLDLTRPSIAAATEN